VTSPLIVTAIVSTFAAERQARPRHIGRRRALRRRSVVVCAVAVCVGADKLTVNTAVEAPLLTFRHADVRPDPRLAVTNQRDVTFEPDETFVVDLSNAMHGRSPIAGRRDNPQR